MLIYGPFYDWPGVVFLGSSLLSNIFSTAVIAFKTWCGEYICHPVIGLCSVRVRSHRRRLRGHLLGSRRTMAEKILVIFVESGAIFISIWVCTPCRISCGFNSPLLPGHVHRSSREIQYFGRRQPWVQLGTALCLPQFDGPNHRKSNAMSSSVGTHI